MKENSADVFKRVTVPKINSPENFNLEKYMEKDKTIHKKKASAWGRGDFKALIRITDDPFYEAGAEEMVKFEPEQVPEEKPVEEVKPVTISTTKFRNYGYRKRTIELSEHRQ